MSLLTIGIIAIVLIFLNILLVNFEKVALNIRDQRYIRAQLAVNNALNNKNNQSGGYDANGYDATKKYIEEMQKFIQSSVNDVQTSIYRDANVRKFMDSLASSGINSVVVNDIADIMMKHKEPLREVAKKMLPVVSILQSVAERVVQSSDYQKLQAIWNDPDLMTKYRQLLGTIINDLYNTKTFDLSKKIVEKEQDNLSVLGQNITSNTSNEIKNSTTQIEYEATRDKLMKTINEILWPSFESETDDKERESTVDEDGLFVPPDPLSDIKNSSCLLYTSLLPHFREHDHIILCGHSMGCVWSQQIGYYMMSEHGHGHVQKGENILLLNKIYIVGSAPFKWMTPDQKHLFENNVRHLFVGCRFVDIGFGDSFLHRGITANAVNIKTLLLPEQRLVDVIPKFDYVRDWSGRDMLHQWLSDGYIIDSVINYKGYFSLIEDFLE